MDENEPALPRLFDYKTITTHLKASKELIVAVERAFVKLADNETEFPLPMHIGIPETGVRIHYQIHLLPPFHHTRLKKHRKSDLVTAISKQGTSWGRLRGP